MFLKGITPGHRLIDPDQIYWRGDGLLRANDRNYQILFERRQVRQAMCGPIATMKKSSAAIQALNGQRQQRDFTILVYICNARGTLRVRSNTIYKRKRGPDGQFRKVLSEDVEMLHAMRVNSVLLALWGRGSWAGAAGLSAIFINNR